ncbi:MAG TPA: discoidin domain-containing protein, partial [Candidatus Tripitaka californicus]|uniref:discoidin domain-containing protein n=1 Tax=Candidatus Tripitaka californicus TaxID=3367616 RepID=UPI004025A4F6
VVRSKFRRPSWVMIDFGTDKGEVINTFQALPRGEAPSHFWRQAVLQGSNNGFFWAKLAKVYVGQPPPSSEWLTWHFDANRRYRYYRLYIKSGFFSGKRFVSFAEWRFGHTDPSMDNGIASKVQRQKGSIPNVLMTSLGRSTLGLLLAYLGVVLVALMPVFAGVASRCRGWMEDWLGDYIGRLVIKDRLAPSAGTLLIIAIVSLSLIAGYTYLFKGTHELGQRPISLAQYPHRASSCFKKEYPPNNLSDGNLDSFWHIDNTYTIRNPWWIRVTSWALIDFLSDRGEVINTFQAFPRIGNLSHFWHKALLQGSNNGFFWTRLADVSLEQEPTSEDWLTWHFDAKKRYRYYRLFIESGFFSSNGRFVSFAEWKFSHSELSGSPNIASAVQKPEDSIRSVWLAAPGRGMLFFAPVFAGAFLVILLTVLSRMGRLTTINETIELLISNPRSLRLPLFCLLIVLFCVIYHELLLSKRIFTHDGIIWFSPFYYGMDSLVRGYLPLWDPYLLAGAPSYPQIHIHGLLDPLIALPLLMIKALGATHLTSFTYLYLARLFVFALGVYYLFRHVTGCGASSLVSAGILFFFLANNFARQTGVVTNIFLTPFILYFLLLFFENVQNNRRYLYFLCLVAFMGINMNIHLPAPLVFNLLMFTTIAVVLRIIRVEEFIRALRDIKFLVFLCAGVLILLMMLAPSAAVYKDCRGMEGEIFPSERIISHYGCFKKLMASEIGESGISNTFVGGDMGYIPLINISFLICPDLWRQFFEGSPNYVKGAVTEAFLYIGMIALVFCIIGLLYSKSRYRYLAFLMVLMFLVNVYSRDAVSGHTPNVVQQIFNAIVPLFSSYHLREELVTFIALYLGMLLSLGLKLFFNVEEFTALLREKYLQIASICIGIVLIKIVLGRVLYTSMVDLFGSLTLVGMAVFVCAYARGFVSKEVFNVFYILVVLTMLVDISYSNYSRMEYTTHENWLAPHLSRSEERATAQGGFEYFRIPFYTNEEDIKNNCEPLGFGESLFKVKGAMSRGYTHHFFTTKRYYDYMTHVPLENQFVLSGIVYPIVRFFPADRVKTMPKRELLNYLETAEADALGQYLFLEGQETSTGANNNKEGPLDLNQVPCASCFGPFVIDAYSKYLEKNGERVGRIRRGLERYLHTPGYQLEVRHFSPNELEIMVKNQEEGYLYYNDGWSKYWKAFDG